MTEEVRITYICRYKDLGKAVSPGLISIARNYSLKRNEIGVVKDIMLNINWNSDLGTGCFK